MPDDAEITGRYTAKSQLTPPCRLPGECQLRVARSTIEDLAEFTLVRRFHVISTDRRIHRTNQRHQVAKWTVRRKPEPTTVLEHATGAGIIRRDAGEESFGERCHFAAKPFVTFTKQSRRFRCVVPHSKRIQVANASRHSVTVELIHAATS